MQIIRDVSRGRWLVDRAGAWARVGGVAGTGFEAYARILHPIHARREDLTVTLAWGRHPVVEESTWSWSMLAARTGRVMHPLVQSRRLTDNETRMDFDDGWRLDQIREGWLDPGVLAILTRHLTTATPDDIVIGIWDGWGLPDQAQAYTVIVSDSPGSGDPSDSGDPDDESAQWEADFRRQEQEAAESVSAEFRAAVQGGPHLDYPGRRFVLLQTSLSELARPDWGVGAGIGWTTDNSEPSPQVVWPEDHAWVVASEIDWDSTIVAGSRSVVDAILADPALEAFEVAEDDDLTWDGDLVNEDRAARG